MKSSGAGMRSKLTRWEAVNDLTAICDLMADKEKDLEKEHPDIAAIIRKHRLELGDFFNAQGTHAFLLPDTGGR